MSVASPGEMPTNLPSPAPQLSAFPQIPGLRTAESILKSSYRPPLKAEAIIGVAIDRSASTSAFGVGVPIALQFIFEGLSALVSKFTITVQSHSDLEFGEPIEFVAVDVGVDAALAAVSAITYEGGHDDAETHLDAVQHALRTIPWFESPKAGANILIVFTTASTKPCRDGQTPESLGAKLRGRNIALLWIGEPDPQLHALCRAAEGEFAPISNTPNAAELHRAAKACVRFLTQTLARGATVPMSALPTP